MKRDDVGDDTESIPLPDEIEDVVTAVEEPELEEEKVEKG
jgi:hypothetical protein